MTTKLRMKELRTEQNVDTDNLLVKVTGKGNKECYVPISIGVP